MRLIILLTILSNFVFAQAVLDHVEIVDKGIPVPLIHISYIPQQQLCKQANIPCNDIISTTLLPDTQYEAALKDVDKAWEDYYENVSRHIDKTINQKPYCYVPPFCLPFEQPLPIPDPVCIAERITRGLAEAFAQYQPIYWGEVNKAIATYLPNSIVWTALPPIGQTSSAIFSLVPKPDQYFQIRTNDIREIPYFTAGLTLDPVVAALPNEADFANPGINPLEASKENWLSATPFEYERFGFATFAEFHMEVLPIVYQKASLLPPDVYPGIQFYCTAIIFDLPLPIKTPIPVPAPTPVAVARQMSVAEGYQLPYMQGPPFALPIPVP